MPRIQQKRSVHIPQKFAYALSKTTGVLACACDICANNLPQTDFSHYKDVCHRPYVDCKMPILHYFFTARGCEDKRIKIQNRKPVIVARFEIRTARHSNFIELAQRSGAQPPREFEHVYYTFELIMDQGAFCEFKRHRMLTLSPQEPTVLLGYATPPPMEEAGLKGEFESAMKASEEAFSAIAEENPYAAGYIATNAHNRRVLTTMNLRELIHFVKLRTTPFAHFTIRDLALEMQEAVLEVHPEFKPFLNARRLP